MTTPTSTFADNENKKLGLVADYVGDLYEQLDTVRGVQSQLNDASKSRILPGFPTLMMFS